MLKPETVKSFLRRERLILLQPAEILLDPGIVFAATVDGDASFFAGTGYAFLLALVILFATTGNTRILCFAEISPFCWNTTVEPDGGGFLLQTAAIFAGTGTWRCWG